MKHINLANLVNLATAAAGMALASAQLALAAPNAYVEAVQMPAWVERGSAKIPLSPGMELRDNDQLRTGANSRLLLKMGEGSSVKLGENGLLRLDSMAQRSDNVFRAAMKVAEGAFRFTTDALAKHRRRNVNITIATVTAGVRGTDLWGKSEPNRQVVCLIEGKIDVTPPGEQTIVMDQALQFYIRDNGKSQPVAAVDPKQLAQWSLETEIAPGKGAARRGGKWKVVAASVEDQEGAFKVYDALRANGYAAEIHPAKAGGTRVYAVRLANLPSKAEAEALAGSLRGKMGVEAPRVSM